VAHHLVRRCIQAARFRRAAWDEACQALGMPEDEIKRTYPLWGTDEENWAWR
jgi:hypothetical protein